MRTRRHVHNLCRAMASWLALAALALSAAPASAEALPSRVILSHVPTISTWGPITANGVVVYTLEEGDVRGDLVGLPVLGDDERYELWLVNTTTGEQLSLLRFNAASDGQTTFIDALLPEPIPDRGWDQVRVTVEPEPDPDPAPDSRIAIVGGVAGTEAEVLQFPAVLPETGIGGESSDGVAVAVGGGLIALGLGMFAVLRRRVTREAR